MASPLAADTCRLWAVSPTAPDVPVVLFVYARPALLTRVLGTLRENGVPMLHVYSDGARGADDAAAVAEVRRMVRAIDWADVHVHERAKNFGLGRNVLAGVSEIAQRYESFVVWEDDLLAASGTYRWLCAALERFRDEPGVMSVTAWTHPAVTPSDVDATPYFDGRAECWVWGAWRRSWMGMPEETALEKMHAAERRGVARDAYGNDLPAMAAAEARRNIWAVRWLYHHLQHGGLCCRPPWNCVEHIGVGREASNANELTASETADARPAPAPRDWPEPRENPECRSRWLAFARRDPWSRRLLRRVRRLLSR